MSANSPRESTCGETTLKNTTTTSVARQVCCVLILSTSITSIGNFMSWPTVLQLEANSTLQFYEEDIKWLTSLPCLCYALTPLGVGYLVEILGPSRLLAVSFVPIIALWLIMGLIPSRVILYVGRCGLGIVEAVPGTVVQPYTAELASPELRGLMTSLPETFMTFGVFMMYLLTMFSSPEIATAACAAPIALVLVLMITVPESPYWLMRKGKEERARKAMQILRGRNADISNDIDEIKEALSHRPSSTFKEQYAQIKDPSNYRPALLVFIIFTLKGLNGYTVILAYSVDIFQDSGIDLDPRICSCILGALALFFSLISAVITDFVGRRPLLIGSALTGTLALAAVSVVVLIPTAPNELVLGFVLLYIAFHSIGVGPIPWLYLGELLPNPVRSLSSSWALSGHMLVRFVLELEFPSLKDSIGLAYTFLIFAVVHAAIGIVTWKWVPETRGATLAFLQETFAEETPPFKT
ncbi:facilitated trehalose transporter Tret1-like [Oratosquilla oratoria]|uniref:facilitated trehalose transporter Tret1-like n=1 Tax=Oratosquilla oratoria TaxID=337810 RepID=UPI003F769852